MDRISELPLKILHQILSLLPTKTAARTAVLSKPWLKACYTNPYLCFDQYDFEGPRPHNGMFIDFHDQFVRIVDNTLERYRSENLPVSAFNLCITESAIESLISCCSLIVTISFQCCFGFNCIRVSKSLPNLLSLHILECPVMEVHIGDAPKMLSFEYVIKYVHSLENRRLRMLKIGTCQNLRRLEFENADIDDTVLFELIPKLHLIKELILHRCNSLNKIKISSSTLEVCSIVQCEYLVLATFDVPKLLSLTVKPQQSFDKYGLPCLSFQTASSQCRISIDYGNLWVVEQCIHLRRSLVELNDHVVDLTLRSIHEGLRSASGIDHLPIPEVENLILLFPEYSTNFLDVIFSICWPKCITFHYYDNQKCKKLLRQQLLKKRYWRFTKCAWKEYMMNAQIEYKKRTQDNWMTLDRKILAADSLYIQEMKIIRLNQNQREEKN